MKIEPINLYDLNDSSIQQLEEAAISVIKRYYMSQNYATF